MSIVNIKNVYVRRLTLLVAFIPLILIGIIFYTGKAILEILMDIPGSFVGAWNGR